MPDITDAEAVRFADEEIRPFADKLAVAYYAAVALVDDWNARGLGSLFPNDSSPVIDGSAADGRPPITGAMVNNIINRASELKADLSEFSNAKLNTLLQVAVNP
jgi:hypothetical protein